MRYIKTEAKFKSHYILKCFFRQFSINDKDVSAGKSNRKCHSIYLCRYKLRFGNLRRGNRSLKYTFNGTTNCKSTWDTAPYFGINGLSMILCLWFPIHPLSKLLAVQDHAQNFEEQLWMGGRREVSIISHRPVTRSDLKQERSFFLGSVSVFLQLIVASCYKAQSLYTKQRFSERFTEEQNRLFEGFNNYR